MIPLSGEEEKQTEKGDAFLHEPDFNKACGEKQANETPYVYLMGACQGDNGVGQDKSTRQRR